MTVGIELDGRAAHMVTSSDGIVTAATSFSGRDGPTALLSALNTLRRGDSVRVLVATPGMSAVALEVPAGDVSLPAVTALAAARAGVDASAVAIAALLEDSAATAGRPLVSALATIAPASVVSAVFAAATGAGFSVQVVAPPAAPIDGDGLVLALRAASADLALVRAGSTLAWAQLPVPSLEALAARLSPGGASREGADRLARGLTGTVALDPLAVAEADRWLIRVAEAVADQLDVWLREGHRGADTVFVYGPGAASARLAATLAQGAGLHVAYAPPWTKALSMVATGERHKFVGAYLTAAASARFAPMGVFADPAAVAAANTALARGRRLRRARTFGGAAAAAALLVAAPLVSSAVAASSAAREAAAVLVASPKLAASATDAAAISQLGTGYVLDVLALARAAAGADAVVSVEADPLARPGLVRVKVTTRGGGPAAAAALAAVLGAKFPTAPLTTASRAGSLVVTADVTVVRPGATP